MNDRPDLNVENPPVPYVAGTADISENVVTSPSEGAASGASGGAEVRCRCGLVIPAGAPRCAKGHHAPGNALAFPEGNTLSLRHGARSPRTMVAATTAAHNAIDDALADQPGSEDRYALARHHAAGVMARVNVLAAYVERVGPFDRHGRPRPILRELAAAQASLKQWLDALALTPMSAAKLGVGLEALSDREKARNRRIEDAYDRMMKVTADADV